MKLHLKPTILPYQLPGLVVLHVNGEYAKVPDPTGAVWQLFLGLDGHRDADTLVRDVLAAFPGADRDSLNGVLDDCIKHRLVEVPDTDCATTLAPDTLQRISRNLDFFGSMAPFGASKFAYQERLLEKRVCVLGCGGLGTHILFDLAALGIRHLTILDFDTIEWSNLNRQILYRETDIGRSKVHVARQRLLEFNSALEIEAHCARLASADDVKAVVQGHDIVICVADKPANQIADWLNEACVACGVPFISGGLDVRRAVFYSVQPGVSGCVHCWSRAARRKSTLFDTLSPLNKQHDITLPRPAPAFVTLVAVTAGMMVSEAVKYLSACQPPALHDKLKEFRFDDLSVDIAETWQRDPACEVCGHLTA